jgi:hypothetical protein
MVWHIGIALLIFQLLRWIWHAINKLPEFPEEQQLPATPLPSATLAVAQECKTTIHIIDQILSAAVSSF